MADNQAYEKGIVQFWFRQMSGNQSYVCAQHLEEGVVQI